MKNITLQWQKIAEVPAQFGYKKNIGTAGLLKGTLDNYLIVGGGANFPDGSPVEGGKKVNHKDIYLFKATDEKIELLDQISFDYPFSYGATTTNSNNLYHITTNDKGKADIIEFSIINNKLVYNIITTLDFSIENIILEYVDNSLIFGCGSINGNLDTTLYKFNLSSHELTTLTNFPGNSRSQCLSTIVNNELFIYGGGANITYTDGYKYNFDSDEWSKLAELIIDNKEYSLLGSDWVKLDNYTMLATGGFNDKLWKHAVHQLTTLKGEELQHFREYYFSMPVCEYNWNKEVFIYNISEDNWSIIDRIPYEAPCGHALLKINNSIYSIMGEIKPAVRTANIYHSKIK